MSITIIKHPSDYCFTGNPVVFEVSSDLNEPVNVEISFNGETRLATYYPFRLSENSFKISMNLSDYLYFKSEIKFSGTPIIAVIANFAKPYRVKIGDNYIFNGFALQGGISNHAFHILNENGYDVFSFRLSSSSEQFLFTTRTNAKEIKLKETELYPFIFKHPGVPLIFRSEYGDEITTPAQAAGTFCAMNIQSVLNQMSAGAKSVEVCPAGEYAFHFAILPGKRSEERYLLRFRNSLGAFELLEVTGKAMHAPEFSEENLWETLTGSDFYEERRARLKRKGIIEVETGYKERREFPFILDLIQSDEIYFIYPDGDSFRCHLTADSTQYRQLMTERTSVKLKIRPTVEEEFVTPKIEFPAAGDVSLLLSKQNIFFGENEDSDNIEVVIHGTQNRAYSVINLPSWLSVTNKTETGFSVNVEENPTGELRNVDLIVRLDTYPAVQATLSVMQAGAWLSTFIFDVETTAQNEHIERIINLGAVLSGDARFDYGDGSPVEIRTVDTSSEINTTDSFGNPVAIFVGHDFDHTYANAGTYTIRVDVRQGVNIVRFSTVLDGSSVNDWGAEFIPNPYIRTIRRMKSDFITSAYKMFAGCSRASFDLDWDGLEMPNLENFNFIMENFGSYGSGQDGAFTVNDRMRFPSNMYQHVTSLAKAKAHTATRCYFQSGFEKIEQSMLSFAANGALVSAMETFRGMGNVGRNWTDKYAPSGVPGQEVQVLAMERFINMNVFWNQPNIQNFEGCFNAINDFYGSLQSGYAFPLLLEQDLFKNNMANNLNLNWMFNKCTRLVLGKNLFRYLNNGQRIKTMAGCFWNFNHGSPRLSWDGVLNSDWWGSRIDQHPDSLFPDASYPNMENMAGAFGFYGDLNINGGKRELHLGFQGLWGANEGQVWDSPTTVPNQWGWTANMPSVAIADFLSRFPNVTPTSGLDPRDYATVCDGAAFNFGDWDVPDDNGTTRANDVNSITSRLQVKEWVKIN